jgi:hypothetical protein
MSRDLPTLVERGVMKSLMQLWQVLAHEMGEICDTNTTLDIKTVKRRVECEGLSFLTITLSNFCTDLQKGLDRGYVDHDLFKSFSFKGGLPRFLGGFLGLVFDRESGKLLDDPSIDAIFALRQLTLFYSKIRLDCSEERTRRSINGYIECEMEVRKKDEERTSADYRSFSRVSLLLCADVFSRVDLRIFSGNIRPKHGPGSTAERIRGNSKFRQREWPVRLENTFPALEYITSGWKDFPILEHVNFLEPCAERPVRVITVHKTLKAPRIIAIEPVAMQYTQQAVLECFMDELKGDDILSQFIKFDDQSFNQALARKGSIDGSLATLDLSEASDRVSNQLVRAMLANFPHFAEAVDASRSRKADVPGFGVIRLAKFASMGSALCFPMEALTFLTLVFLGIQKELNLPLNRQIIQSFVGQVCIFGDDIIIPDRFVSATVDVLEAFGFRVNTNKSFWNGKFRESCGGDYYGGHDVSVVKCHELLPTRKQHVDEVISTVSLRNQLYELGLWKTCQWIDDLLRRVLRHYPTVNPTSSVLGRHSYLGYQTQLMDVKLHTPLVKGYVVEAILPESKLDGEHALLKYFLKRGIEPFDEEHLERAGRPDAVSIKLRWSKPY